MRTRHSCAQMQLFFFAFVLVAPCASGRWPFFRNDVPRHAASPDALISSWTREELLALGRADGHPALNATPALECAKGVFDLADVVDTKTVKFAPIPTTNSPILAACTRKYEHLRQFAECANVTAIALSLASSHSPWTYGHVYDDYINPLYNLLARDGAIRGERATMVMRTDKIGASEAMQKGDAAHNVSAEHACERDRRGDGSVALARSDDFGLPFAQRAIDVFLPVGAFLDAHYGPCAFEEAFALFPERLTGFRLHPATWVPICDGQNVCVRHGTAPAGLRARLALVLLHRLRPAAKRVDARLFREAAWRAVGLLPLPLRQASPPPPSAHVTSTTGISTGGGDADQAAARVEAVRIETAARTELAHPGLVTFISTVHNSVSKRAFEDEAALVNASRAFFRLQAPELRFHLLDHGSVSFAEEVRVISHTAVLITLFGSALHNCRFLPPGAIVIQLHGATKNEYSVGTDLMYYGLCSRLGARWVPYRIPGSIPLGVSGRNNQLFYNTTLGGLSPASRARVNLTDFTGRFLPSVLRGEWEGLFREFVNSRRAQTEPHRATQLPLLPTGWVVDNGLRAQYRQRGLHFVQGAADK